MGFVTLETNLIWGMVDCSRIVELTEKIALLSPSGARFLNWPLAVYTKNMHPENLKKSHFKQSTN